MRVAGVLTAVVFGTTIVIMQPAATALTSSEVASIAQKITVRIDGANTGSGVIIERQGNIYTVVTCWHVVQLEGNYTIQTPDGKKYTLQHSQVKRFPGVDLAVFQFTSNKNYSVAENGNSDQVTLGKTVHVAGYPQGTSDIDFRSGSISRLVTNPKDGYAFVYDIGGFPGMSGGAILDEQGKLVGIHGRATTHPSTSATTVYGIPLKTYLSLASSGMVGTAPTPQPQNPTDSTPLPVNSNNSSNKFFLAKTLDGHSTNVEEVAFSRDGRNLASSSDDGTIKIWNVATRQEIRTIKGHSERVWSVAFSPDGQTLASGSWDKTIKIWNVSTGEEIRTLKGHSGRIWSVAFSPDGNTLASGDYDATIKIWNVATGQEIHTLKGHSERVWSVAISPDGRTLASASGEGTIKIWNFATGEEIRTLNGHSSDVHSVTFSPDGNTLASGSEDDSIKIWNVATGQEIRTLNSHSDGVLSVAFSPNGRTLASGSKDDTIKIWNVATGQEIDTLKGHYSDVLSVAISPDSKTLATSSSDKTIKLWRLSE